MGKESGMVSEKERDLFENHGVLSAVLRLVKLSAATVCLPAFMFLSALSNLFGVGAASVIARALGARDGEKVRHASAFAFWGCLTSALVYSLLALVLLHPYVDLLGGTDPEVHRHAAEYITVTVILGGSATACATLLSHLIRAEGRALLASTGIMLGGLLNIALDPLFMFRILPPGREALGAAVATALSNCVTLVYFGIVLFRIRRKSLLSIKPCRQMVREAIPTDVFGAGIPACVMTLFENVSYAVLDKLMSFSGVPMQAGLGVAKKVNMLAHCIVRGIAQGALPLIGYNYAARNFARMRSSFKVARTIAVGAAAVCMLISLVFSRELIGLFIHHGSASLDYGTAFLRILCVGGPFSAAAYTVISFFQAVGEGKKSFFLAVLRKGLVDIPMMFLLSTLIPVYGIVAATPITDAVCCLTAYVIYLRYIRSVEEHRHAPCIVKEAA